MEETGKEWERGPPLPSFFHCSHGTSVSAAGGHKGPDIWLPCKQPTASRECLYSSLRVPKRDSHPQPLCSHLWYFPPGSVGINLHFFMGSIAEVNYHDNSLTENTVAVMLSHRTEWSYALQARFLLSSLILWFMCFVLTGIHKTSPPLWGPSLQPPAPRTVSSGGCMTPTGFCTLVCVLWFIQSRVVASSQVPLGKEAPASSKDFPEPAFPK